MSGYMERNVSSGSGAAPESLGTSQLEHLREDASGRREGRDALGDAQMRQLSLDLVRTIGGGATFSVAQVF